MLKQYDQVIYDYINDVMATYPQCKVYFANTRIDEPAKPFVLISEVSNDEIHKTNEYGGVITEFRRVYMTIGVYFDSKVITNMNLTKEICAYLRLKLSQNTAVDYFQAEKMSNRHEMISQTRNLSESVSGGFVYRYEFDIAFDYENSLETGALESKGVNVEVSNIEFEL